MKKFLIAITVLIISFASQAQNYIRGSVRLIPDPTKVDIVFKPNFTSISGEYIFLLQFTLAIPAAGNESVTATAVGVNAFSYMGTLDGATPYTETHDTSTIADDERIFTWIFANPEGVDVGKLWTNEVEFKGVEVTFSTSVRPSGVKMVDFTNIDGGLTEEAYFGIASTAGGDLNNYAALFYATFPNVSELGTYPNGDQFVYSGTTPIPTLSQWGLIIFILMLLSVGMLFVQRRQNALVLAGNVTQVVKPSLFDNRLYLKVLGIVLPIAVCCLAVAYWYFGTLSITDSLGTLVSAGIVVYMVQLCLLMRRK